MQDIITPVPLPSQESWLFVDELKKAEKRSFPVGGNNVKNPVSISGGVRIVREFTDAEGVLDTAFDDLESFFTETGIPAGDYPIIFRIKDCGPFDSFEIEVASLTVTKPEVCEYKVNAYGMCSSTPAEGVTGEFVYVEQITDGVSDEMDYDYNDVIKSVQNFFYSEISGGFHTGGVYYGDYILKNISKYYKHFSLNDDKTELTFEINISTPTEEGNEILNCHKFVVNQYGLIVSVYTIAYHISNDEITQTLITEMNCDYVTEFEKITKLGE